MSGAARLEFHGGLVGALVPFALFVAGVSWLALSGAPDERGFWPVLIASLLAGVALARDRRAYGEAVLDGMTHRLVALMILAWMLAGVMAALLGASGFVEALVWAAGRAGLAGGAYCVAAFLICCAVSSATGTSLGTILVCAPLLYPAGGALGAQPAVLVGAILGGATFGDNLSPVSDTTIASATSQGAAMGDVVRSRLRYAVPAAVLASAGYLALGAAGRAAAPGPPLEGGGGALWMLLVPATVVLLLLRGQPLVVGLAAGVAGSAALGVALGLIRPGELLFVDPDAFSARGLILDGAQRAVGVSIFTLLLMGLVAGLEAGGIVGRLAAAAERRVGSARGAELSLFGVVSAAVVLTTHSVVAILTAAGFARSIGRRFGIGPLRRANLLDVTVCTYPFLLPYCIPTILAASTTRDAGGAMPAVSALSAGVWNLHAWMLLAVLLVAILSGWGRDADRASG